MLIKPAARPDWFVWLDPPADWSRAFAELPGLQWGVQGTKMMVHFHISHIPCLPDHEREVCGRMLQPTPHSFDLSQLRPYQAADFERIRDMRGALLAYEMRLGKSALACHLHDPNDGLLIIVGPLAAREVWRDWVARVHGSPPFVLSGVKDVEAQLGYRAYFCHYDILHAHAGFFLNENIGTLIIDEVHLLQARGTKRLTAVNLLVPHAKRILGLSGTPMWNKPRSLWTILHLISPGAWGTQFEARRRYADAQPGAHGWTYDGISHPEELQARLSTIMVRRTWKDVAPELPPTVRVIEPVEVSGAKLVEVEAAATKLALARGTSTVAGYLATLRRKLAALKVKPAVVMAMQAADDDHKVVLWTWHNEIADKVTAALEDAHARCPFGLDYTLCRLRAADSPDKRDAEVARFRAATSRAFMVASMSVGGVGLDLSCSDYTIFVEMDWTPAVVQQAEMRTFHPSRPHCVVYLHTDDMVETKLVEALDVKNGFAAAIGLSTQDVMERVLT